MDDDHRYLNHYGLIAAPFRDLNDRRFIWLGEKQLEILAHLKIGVEQTKGILLLLGEDGSGKSVLLGCLPKIIAGDLSYATLAEPGIGVNRFFAFLGDHYHTSKPISTKTDFLIHFRNFLLEAKASDKNVLLVVEDAENQDDEVIEQIRLLSNMEDDGSKLLSILLVGNHKLSERLNEHRHRALLQRVAVRCEVEALGEKETGAYIRHRMMAGGCFLEIFTTGAVRAIHAFSGGIPKLIDVICDHALMRGCLEGVRTIDGKLMDAYAKAIRKAFQLGCSDLRAAALASLQATRRTPGQPRSSKWLAAALALAAFALAGLGIRWVTFEGKPETAATAAPPAAPARVSLYFDAGSTKLPAQDFPKLDALADYLTQNPQGAATIQGYADSKGSPAQNHRISALRAQAAKEYLVGKGVDPDRIQIVGVGTLPPTGVDRASVEEQKLRRRVEIEVSRRSDPIH
jgi:general secretion pathway protein A